MSGHLLPLGEGPWQGGDVTSTSTCVLAPNPSAWTLEGTNTWVISTGQRAVVIDPGPNVVEHLLAIRTAAGDAHIDEVLLTHGHIDHAEGASDLARSLGIGVRALDPAHRLGGEGLAEGDRIDLGDLELQVVATPGHSSDSVSFLIPHEGSLLTGDTVLGRGTTLVAYPDGALAEYLTSLKRIRELAVAGEIQQILPGHGPVVTHPIDALDYYLTHRAERLEQVRNAVAEGNTTVMSLVDLLYADVPTAVRPAAEVTVKAQLAYLGLPVL